MQPQDIAVHIDSMKERFEELEEKLAAPEIYSKPAECKALSRERQCLAGIFKAFELWNRTLEQIRENRELLEHETDPDFLALLQSDLAELERKSQEIEQQLTIALIPRDSADARDTIVELRPAAGGEEAALFAAEMFRMYLKFAEKKGWRAEVLDQSDSDLGGIREATLSLSGTDVFSLMKFESGVHRVQRVPATESGGRIHTSTITVSVLPEADETDDIEIRHEDLEISTFRSSGPGGQNVNRTDSAVRIVHKPSGLVVASQQERSQIRNREIALRILKAKLLEIQRREEAARHAASKRMQVGTGDRSERIRTYNFPQNRITDHRYGVSAYDLPSLMEGNLDLILTPILEVESKRAIDSILASHAK